MVKQLQSAYYHLKNVSRIRELMSQQDLEKRVRAFIFSRLDYCNGVFTGLSKKAIGQSRKSKLNMEKQRSLTMHHISVTNSQ